MGKGVKGEGNGVEGRPVHLLIGGIQSECGMSGKRMGVLNSTKVFRIRLDEKWRFIVRAEK